MRRLPALLALSLLATPAFASEKRHVEAHEHGHGRMTIAVEGKEMEMEFEAPGADLVGFEHKAGNDEERGKVAAAIARLKQPQALFALPKGADCTLEEAEVEQEFEGTHAAFHAHYHFNCATPSALDRIEFHYFSAFPGAEEVEVTMVGASGQKSYEVERDAPLLRLR